MARYAVVLDACVLVPVTLADTLLRLAELGLYRPLWSKRILAEATKATVEVHPNIPREVLEQRFREIERAFEDACVRGWHPLEHGLTLPDPDDRHVVAAALAGGADAIVTRNLRDYPRGALADLTIEVTHPDDFLLDQLDLAPKAVLDAIEQQAANTRQPSLTPRDVIARLARCGVPTFADKIGRMI
ncbi:conserved hypothetical protein [Acidimicrobium ferrooxidans DSM 10331]|uniref:Uncharacterized protein n=1 Tax=Acidimicrobium ferrooxidans (strain DSM 10331 / JCM 15462 / NBRC 103882 / ICP) TaxID=525909 RepID=C7M0P4_ACIFD|nr:PIN domain-containing protein [Acidimicrobium ferrooxidans]ACU54552.1 conserved hypothetical protein [Acidimicrobium ferrooxidans DSM 10331]